MQWYLKAFRQYADFRGRARRTEFWMFTLFNAIAFAVAALLDNLLGLTYGSGIPYGVLYTLYGLAVLIPSLAVAARRLHDTDRSGWWQLIGIIPLVGTIILIVFYVSDGQPGSNRHGMNPKAVPAQG